MAEILISYRNDAPTWRSGDPVVVREDGHTWGRQESLEVWLADGRPRALWPGNFVILKIVGATRAQMRNYIRNRIGAARGDLDDEDRDGDGNRIGGKRRRFRFLLSQIYQALPAAKKQEFQDTRTVTVGAAAAANFLDQHLRDMVGLDRDA